MLGTVDLIGSKQVKKEALQSHFEEHQIKDTSILNYKKYFAWELSDPRIFNPPVRYLQKKACQVWMVMEYPGEEQAIQRLQKKHAEAEKSFESLLEIAKAAGVAHLQYQKKKYFRVMYKDLGICEKFFYKKDVVEDANVMLTQALDLQRRIAIQQDLVSCFQLPELKNALDDFGLPKKGSADTLRKALLQHLVQKAVKEFSNSGKEPQGHGDTAHNKEEEPVQKHGTMACKYFVPFSANQYRWRKPCRNVHC